MHSNSDNKQLLHSVSITSVMVCEMWT